MGVYTTAPQVRDYCADSGVLLPADNQDLERLIERAKRDIDVHVIGGLDRPPSGLVYEPILLTESQRQALTRAVAAQVEYTVTTGPERLTGADDDIVSLGSISFSKVPPGRVGPGLSTS